MAFTIISIFILFIISIFIVFLFGAPHCVHSLFPAYSFFFSSITLPPGVTGPSRLPWIQGGEGPYVGVVNSRIFKWQGPAQGFADLAPTSPKRTKDLCDGTTDPNLGITCGRPLGFNFNSRTGDLYIADSYLCRQVVGPNGGLATSAEGIRFYFLDSVDVDQLTGFVYFSSATTTYDLRNVSQPGFVPDSSRRLLKYDPMGTFFGNWASGELRWYIRPCLRVCHETNFKVLARLSQGKFG